MENTVLDNQYQILRKIATGGMGELYLANQTGNFGYQRQVVIKRLHPELFSDDLHRNLFIQEAVLSGRFTHPNLVQVHGIIEDENGLYMIMEYIVGMDLMGLVRSAIARRSFLPLRHTLHIIAQIGEGLAAVHNLTDSRGRPMHTVHRDVTPSNILITSSGIAKLVDFGVARVLGDTFGTETDIIAGKINYMAPEMLSGGDIDHRVDLFGLGVILYELVVGKRLFRGTPEEARDAILNRPILLPSAVKPGLDPDLEKILLKAVDKNPDYRYQKAEDLVEDLEKYALEHQVGFSRLALSRYLRRFSRTEDAGSDDPEPIAPEITLDFDQGFGEGWGTSEAQGLQLDEPELPENMDDESWFELMASPEKMARHKRDTQSSRPVVAEPAASPRPAVQDDEPDGEPVEDEEPAEPAAVRLRVTPLPKKAKSQESDSPDKKATNDNRIPVGWIALALAVGAAGFFLARLMG